MNNEMYLIHGEDYIKHIEEKAILYSMLKQVACKVAKLPSNRGNKNLSVLAKKTEKIADKMFRSWGIPASYLYTGDSDMLADLMENELIAPEDAGYYACDDTCCCQCGCCCNNCELYEGDENGEDECDYEEYEIEGWAETIETLNKVIHNFFGDDVTVHIVID